MSAAELKKLAKKVWGAAYKGRLAFAMDVHATTAWRWLSGDIPVPGAVATAMRCLAQQKCMADCRKKSPRRGSA